MNESIPFDTEALTGDDANAFFDTLNRLRAMAERAFTERVVFTLAEDQARSDCANEFFKVGLKSGFKPRHLVMLVLSDLPGLRVKGT